jgi:uncharacterized membrane protein
MLIPIIAIIAIIVLALFLYYRGESKRKNNEPL